MSDAVRGRPRLDDGIRRKPISVWLTPGELRLACEAATVNHQTVSSFVRDAIVDASYECLEAFPEDEHQPRCQP